MKSFWVFGVFISLSLGRWVQGLKNFGFSEGTVTGNVADPLMVPLTLIQSAAEKGAVCLDGTVPGYHLDRGFDSGANSWLIHLEGGGWCNNIESCVERLTTHRGSSNFMENPLAFTGILSNKPQENPDFFNWNRVKVRYCDGASFKGEGIDKDNHLFFRGQRIWVAEMEDLMSKGMQNASQALLSGGSAGGLASILHCDEFRALFPESTTIKCLADAGFFLDAVDVGGGRTMRTLYDEVVKLHGVAVNLPKSCTSQKDPTLCFFPENLVDNIQTPLFILNAAYDIWQVHNSLAPSSADPKHLWNSCRLNYANCTASQIQFFQDFRNQMLDSLKQLSISNETGLFINSCFAHGQTEFQDTWFGDDSPAIANKGIAKSVGDWFFDRAQVKETDCPYPCDKTCHNIVTSN